MAPRRQIALCLALFAVPLALLGCGSEDGRELEGEPFSQQESEDLTLNLAQVDELVADGDCEGARGKVEALVAATGEFPPERDAALKADLITLLGDLEQQINADCVEGGDTTESSSTTTDDPVETETTTTTDSVPQDTTEEPEEEEPTKPPPPPKDEDPSPPVDPPGNGTPPVDPGNSGGEEEPGGVTPRFESDRSAGPGSGR